MGEPDKRCCGSGVCIINNDGECWCGQVWDGEKMVAPTLMQLKSGDPKESGDQGAPDPA